MDRIGIGLAGLGNVGAGVYKHLIQNRAIIGERLGLELRVHRVAVKNPKKKRAVSPPPGIITRNWEELIEDPEVNILVELMGGIDVPYEFTMRALQAGKVVVTGNKALLAERGVEIFEKAAEKGVPIFFEAAVAGGIPIIKSIREGFIGNHIESIHAILNGTSNYILSRMAQERMDFPEALREAQDQGYAEADPALDVNGWDAAHKAIILASLAYGFWVKTSQIHVAGTRDSFVEVYVHPTLVPKQHVLASVNGVFNALMVRGDIVGDTLFYGRGAGQDPTTSSVISDLAQAAIWYDSGGKAFGFTPHGLYGKCVPIEQVSSGYYLRLTVIDEPGVLAQIANILGSHKIGISSVIQPEGHEGDAVPLVLIIHDAPYGRMQTALGLIQGLACVKSPPMMLWVLS
jgi:homoserine dehydrogenase